MATARPATPATDSVIYVVEDEELMGQMIIFCLEKAGYQARLFLDPVAALEAFTAAPRRPELLITDFQMPRMHGLELLARCRALAPGLKSILISGCLTGEALRSFDTKPDEALWKPLTYPEVFAAVNRLLGGAAAAPAAKPAANTPPATSAA